MGNNSVPKFIFRLSRFPVYRGSVLGRFYCITTTTTATAVTTTNIVKAKSIQGVSEIIGHT